MHIISQDKQQCGWATLNTHAVLPFSTWSNQVFSTTHVTKRAEHCSRMYVKTLALGIPKYALSQSQKSAILTPTLLTHRNSPCATGGLASRQHREIFLTKEQASVSLGVT